MTTLTTGDVTSMGKYIIEKKNFMGPMNEAIRDPTDNSPPEPAAPGGDVFTNGAIMGHHCVYDYDSSNCDKLPGGSKKYSLRYTATGYERGGREGALGIVFKFNRLLYHYINLFTDRTSNKIYLPLLEKFANGVNAGEIMKGNAIDDISTKDTNTNPVQTPQNS